MKQNNNHFLLEDLAIVVLSVIIAIIIIKTHILTSILTSTRGIKLFGSFIAGSFFTSAFTTAPAIATLGEIAQVNSIWSTAFFGAIGAVIGDLIIFKFIRDRFSKHVIEIIKQRGSKTRLRLLIKLKFYKWLTFLIGGLIIASPLPDELGISILGFSKMKQSWFILFSFISNFVGIVIIGMVARAI